MMGWLLLILVVLGMVAGFVGIQKLLPEDSYRQWRAKRNEERK